MTPELRRWRIGEGGTTVDTECMRLAYAGQREKEMATAADMMLPIYACTASFGRYSCRVSWAKPFVENGIVAILLEE